jgi:uncharacterized protein (DUF433 family)
LDSSGTVRVGGTRVTLETVLTSYNTGASPEEIVESFDSLKLADVHAVISYYLNHRAEVDEYLRQSEEQAEAARSEIQSRYDAPELKRRLLARRAEMTRPRT